MDLDLWSLDPGGWGRFLDNSERCAALNWMHGSCGAIRM